MTSSKRSFTTVVHKGERGGALIPVPFDPDEVWGPKREHRVGGQVNGKKLRGSVVPAGGGFALRMGPMWVRDCGVKFDAKVKVELFPEGPQRDDLAPDLAAALDAEPKAGEFFDSLAQFYRKAYLRYIDATKRKPEVRAERIKEVVRLLKAGVKERS